MDNLPEKPAQPQTAAELAASVKTLDAERQVMFGQAMDQMEAGVGQYGKYFRKAGYKGGGNNAGYDSRVLLMKEPVQDPATGKEMYVAMTQDGPMGIVPEIVDQNHIDQYKGKGGTLVGDQREFPWDPKRAFRQLIEKGNAKNDPLSGAGGYETPTSTRNPTTVERLSLGDPKLVPILEPGKDYYPVSMEIAKKAIGDSQAKALVPRELDVELARQKAAEAGDLKNQAQELLGFVKALPPKQ